LLLKKLQSSPWIRINSCSSCHFSIWPLNSTNTLFYFLVLNRIRVQLGILHFHPWTPPKLHFGPYLFTPKPFIFRSPNFFSPYLSTSNSNSGDSCAKILRITSSFSSNYSYSYDCCICMILCLSIRIIHFEADIQGLQGQVYEDFQD
jgi:hypothetical protein